MMSPDLRNILDRIEDIKKELDRLQQAYEKEQDRGRKQQATSNRKKLTRPEVERMRKLWETGGWTQDELAAAFCINPGNVSKIVNHKHYKFA